MNRNVKFIPDKTKEGGLKMKKSFSEEGYTDILIDDRVIIPDEIKQMSDQELDLYIKQKEKELHMKHAGF